MLSNFDAATILLNPVKRESYTQRQLIDLFFVDYDLIPLLIFENYVQQKICKFYYTLF